MIISFFGIIVLAVVGVLAVRLINFFLGGARGSGTKASGSPLHPNLKQCPGCGAPLDASLDVCSQCGLRIAV